MNLTKRLVLGGIVCGAISWSVLGQHSLMSVTGQTMSSLTVQFDSASYGVNESDGAVTLTITLSDKATDVVTVTYSTSDGTALADVDYKAASGTVTFAPGVTSQTVDIGIIDNGSYTNDEVYFSVTLTNPSSNATLGTPSTCGVMILDDDAAPVAIINISGVDPAKKRLFRF